MIVYKYFRKSGTLLEYYVTDLNSFVILKVNIGKGSEGLKLAEHSSMEHYGDRQLNQHPTIYVEIDKEEFTSSTKHLIDKFLQIFENVERQ